MVAFNTIHVFGFGNSQFISSTVNKQVASSALSALPAFVAYIKSTKPSDVTLCDYHVIHIFDNFEVKYLGNGLDGDGATLPAGTKTSWSVKWSALDQATLAPFVAELAAAVGVTA